MTAAYSKHFVDVIKRHEQVQKHLVSSHVSMRGASVGISFFKLTFSVPYGKTVLSAIGRNFSSSIHVDPDEGSFNVGPGDSGNAFCFPDYRTKVVLRSKEDLEIFLFNSAIKVN